jgi:hypothetical protein
MLRESLSMEDWDLLQSLIQENRPEDHMAVSQVAHIPSATYAGTPSTAVVPGTGVDFHPPAGSNSVFDPASSTLTTTSEIEHAAQEAMESHARAVAEVEQAYGSQSSPALQGAGPAGDLPTKPAAELVASAPAPLSDPEKPLDFSPLSWIDSLLGVSTPRGRIEVLLGFLLGLAAGSLFGRTFLVSSDVQKKVQPLALAQFSHPIKSR